MGFILLIFYVYPCTMFNKIFWIWIGIWMLSDQQRVFKHSDSENMWLPFIDSMLPNTLRPRQDGSHFADIFKFLNENVWSSLMSLEFVPRVQINNIPGLVKKMAWCLPDDKPLSEPVMVSFLAHIWANDIRGEASADLIMTTCGSRIYRTSPWTLKKLNICFVNTSSVKTGWC